MSAHFFVFGFGFWGSFVGLLVAIGIAAIAAAMRSWWAKPDESIGLHIGKLPDGSIRPLRDKSSQDFDLLDVEQKEPANPEELEEMRVILRSSTPSTKDLEKAMALLRSYYARSPQDFEEIKTLYRSIQARSREVLALADIQSTH